MSESYYSRTLEEELLKAKRFYRSKRMLSLALGLLVAEMNRLCC